MSDRELIELAAKAAGIKLHVWGTEGSENFADMDAGPYGKLWNPLADDGDALRLAITLSIGIRSHGETHWQKNNTSQALWNIGENSGRVTVAHDEDPSRATRRAIVRAAAEIGRKIP